MTGETWATLRGSDSLSLTPTPQMVSNPRTVVHMPDVCSFSKRSLFQEKMSNERGDTGPVRNEMEVEATSTLIDCQK